MDFNVLSTQNWNRMFNVWIEDIQVICHPVVVAELKIQHCFLPKVRTFARYTSLIVILLFSLHCTRPGVEFSRRAATGAPPPPPPPPVNETAQDIYLESGGASWYGGGGDGFAGRPTANGEIYDPAELTCAHRTLPFDTLLEVENLDTGKHVVLRVNDRGPFLRGRILDVSQTAARQLGMIGRGVTTVRIRSVDAKGRPAPVEPQPDNPFTVQVAALSEPANIERLAKDLRDAFGPVNLQPGPLKGGVVVQRVRVGAYPSFGEAHAASLKIAKFFVDRGVEPFVTRRR